MEYFFLGEKCQGVPLGKTKHRRNLEKISRDEGHFFTAGIQFQVYLRPFVTPAENDISPMSVLLLEIAPSRQFLLPDVGHMQYFRIRRRIDSTFFLQTRYSFSLFIKNNSANLCYDAWPN